MSAESDRRALTPANLEFLLGQLEDAIAWVDATGSLAWHSPAFARLCQLDLNWLGSSPATATLAAELAPPEHRAPLAQAIADAACIELPQPSGSVLHLSACATPDGGRLLRVRPVAIAPSAPELQRERFLLELTERMQPATELCEIGQFALSYLIETTGAAFGDVKVISGEGDDRCAGMLTNHLSSQFIASYGDAIPEMEALMEAGIPHGQGLLWEVVATGEPLFVRDYQNHPRAVPQFRRPGIGQLGIFPIPSASGEIIGVLTLEMRRDRDLSHAIERDILLAACRTLGVAIERAQSQTQLLQANRDLERASQLKSEFLASMSHELRTPLNSILGFADLLQRNSRDPLSPRQSRQVEAIARSGRHLLELIGDILDLSKIEAGKIDLDLDSVSIRDLCNQSLQTIQPRAEKKRLALALELDYQLDRAYLDERRVRQILINLLSNAVKFTPENGSIRLASYLAYGNDLLLCDRLDDSPVQPSTPYLCLEVTDTGIGIPAEKQPLLFRPFQQIDSSLTRRHEGTGLGLVLTKRLAELHGGTVTLVSEVGRGTTVRAWLPLTELRGETATPAAPDAPSSPLQRPAPSGSSRILVVEDHPLNQALIAEVLELDGYAVEIVGDGRTMLALIENPIAPDRLPDAIVLDIQLPQVDGFELLHALQQHDRWRDIPAIAVTAMAMAGDRDRCLAAGAVEYISKPLDLDEVLRKVRAVLDSDSPAAAAE